MRWLRWVSLALVVLAVGVFALLMQRLLYTQQGLEFALAQLQRVQTARIEVRGARGVIAGALAFDRVVVDHAAVRVEADDISGTPAFFGLLRGKLAIADASIGRVEVIIKDRGPQPETEIHFLPAWLSIVADDAVVRRAGVTLKNGQRLHAESVRGDLSMTRWRIDVDPVVVEDPAGRVTGNVYLRGTLPLGLRGEVSGRWRLPDERTYRFSARVKGKLDRLGIDASLTEPARLAFSGSGLDLNHEARAVGTLRAVEFDGSPWIPPGSCRWSAVRSRSMRVSTRSA